MPQDIIATLSGLRPPNIPRTQRSAARNAGLQVENRFAVCRENRKYRSQLCLAVRQFAQAMRKYFYRSWVKQNE
jgi:hypothetical protein